MKARFVGAKRKKGVCGAVYQEAEAKGAGYMPHPQKSTWHDNGSDDLQISLLFHDYQSCLQFHSFLSQWHLTNPIVVTHGEVLIDYDGAEKFLFMPKCDWRSVFLQDYMAVVIMFKHWQNFAKPGHQNRVLQVQSA